jgi:acyl-CoA thioester hydrolase
MSQLQAEAIIRVPFYDVDVMRVVWHGNYVKYFEDARCALLDSIDYNYQAMEDSGYAWPVVDCRIKYIKPARFNREIKTIASLVEYENRLKIQYEIIDVESRERLTKGYTVQVAVDIESGEMQFASPQILIEKCKQ